MLAADKLQLQSTLKQQATALKEKEFNLHHNNFMTVGTQAAVLAGLDVTMFIEFQPPPNEEWEQKAFIMIPRTFKFIYYVLITSAFCANILVVAQTTILSVIGASLALRGPDGSMMTATDGLYLERAYVFQAFGYGLVLTVGSVVMVVWLHLHWEASLVCCAISVFTIMKMRDTYYRIVKKFDFDESLTVDFQDIFDGPAAIHAVPLHMWRGLGIGGGAGGRGATNGGKGSYDAKGSFDEQYDRRRQQEKAEEEEGNEELIRRQRIPKSNGLEMV
ncbi:hypothetical protein ACHAXR_010199 [Thalassiosira sp. AJA248-18]